MDFTSSHGSAHPLTSGYKYKYPISFWCQRNITNRSFLPSAPYPLCTFLLEYCNIPVNHVNGNGNMFRVQKNFSAHLNNFTTRYKMHVVSIISTIILFVSIDCQSHSDLNGLLTFFNSENILNSDSGSDKVQQLSIIIKFLNRNILYIFIFCLLY